MNSSRSQTPERTSSPLIRLNFRYIAVVTVSLPLFAFLFCILWSLKFNFKQSTSTHCHVTNFLPSISAAIGGYTPQRYVWKIGIALHSAPRFLVAFMYRAYYRQLLFSKPQWHFLASVACWLHIVEIACLVGLTYISSTENYPAHEKLFITFILCSLLYMLVSCLLPQLFSKSLSVKDQQSLRVKSCAGIISIVSALGAVYFFVRHNWYCEAGIYTLFALCEYTVVLSNMVFHMTAYWDFYDQSFAISPSPVLETNKYTSLEHYSVDLMWCCSYKSLLVVNATDGRVKNMLLHREHIFRSGITMHVCEITSSMKDMLCDYK